MKMFEVGLHPHYHQALREMIGLPPSAEKQENARLEEENARLKEKLRGQILVHRRLMGREKGEEA